MAGNGDELGRAYRLVVDAVDELMYEIGNQGTQRRRAYTFVGDMRPILDATWKAAGVALGRGQQPDDLYRLVLDHMRELPAKLREL